MLEDDEELGDSDRLLEEESDPVELGELEGDMLNSSLD